MASVPMNPTLRALAVKDAVANRVYVVMTISAWATPEQLAGLGRLVDRPITISLEDPQLPLPLPGLSQAPVQTAPASVPSANGVAGATSGSEAVSDAAAIADAEAVAGDETSDQGGQGAQEPAGEGEALPSAAEEVGGAAPEGEQPEPPQPAVPEPTPVPVSRIVLVASQLE